ncbi:MAG: ABC transporter permease subunit [Coriobacteriales bacterium]|jgi:ABC-type spermidine/putrescine transport system permease subunit II|nr:ABC transporter permease subunit [Coriobacteriales bacterium]
MKRATRILILAVAFIVLLLPLVPLVLWSLVSRWRYPEVIPDLDGGFWLGLSSDPRILSAFTNSMALTALVVLASLALSFFAAKNLGTRSFRGKRIIEIALLVPTFFPPIAIVFGMQRVFVQLHLYSTLPGLFIAQLVFYVPYMTLLLSAMFENYDPAYEQQAASLGVGPVKRLFTVTLPAVRAGVVVSCIFCFIGSWSVYLLTNVIAPPAFKTLPTLLFPMMSVGNNSYSMVAVVIILYIAPILLFLTLGSKALVDNRLDTKKGGLL